MKTKLFISGVSTLFCLAIAGCTKPGDNSVTKVEITPASLTLDVGETQTLSAKVFPENADDPTVTWSSDTPAIARVDPETGEVTGVSGGSATIIATSNDSGRKANCPVTVNGGPATIAVTGVEVTPETLTLEIGDTETLSAEVTPEGADDPTVTWSSDEPGIVDVDTQTGEVTAIAEGTATITATTVDGDHTDTCVVTVNPENVLINGVRWATRNVDAPGTFAAAPEDYGMLYQWGRNVAWSATDPLYTEWNTTPYVGSEWLPENDPCPAGWRVPTQNDFLELCNSSFVNNILAERGGVNGRLFTDTATEKSIFLPIAGTRGADGILIVEEGAYWTSRPSSETQANNIRFDDDGNFYIALSYSMRTNGMSVRCVRAE